MSTDSWYHERESTCACGVSLTFDKETGLYAASDLDLHLYEKGEIPMHDIEWYEDDSVSGYPDLNTLCGRCWGDNTAGFVLNNDTVIVFADGPSKAEARP